MVNGHGPNTFSIINQIANRKYCSSSPFSAPQALELATVLIVYIILITSGALANLYGTHCLVLPLLNAPGRFRIVQSRSCTF